MKYYIIIMATAIAILTVSSCHPSGSTTTTPAVTTPDTTFNGSYFDITYNGKSYHCKDAVVESHHWNMLITNSTAITTASNGTVIQLSLTLGISGIGSAMLYFAGSGSTGTYVQNNFPLSGYNSWLIQSNPATQFTDTTGTASITHIGSDYLQGTFNITLNTSGFSYPATGNFKIMH